MKVLITGGAGFIGSHTADRLLKEGYEVRVLDSLQKPIHNSIPEYLDERIEFMAGSATDVRAITEALQGVDYVYHLAAFQDYLPYFSRFVDVNVSSTARIYEIIVRDNSPPSSAVKSNIPLFKFSSNLVSGRTSLPKLSRYNPSPSVA